MLRRVVTDSADEVLWAARQRAEALAARDAEALRRLMHPALRWTTYRGAVLDRAEYIRGNTDPALVWIAQELDQVEVSVVGETAVLIAVVTDTVEEGGARQVNRLRLTQTWIKAAETWVCLAGHAGPPVA
jgi:ketosteroid isomerase-like protein